MMSEPELRRLLEGIRDSVTRTATDVSWIKEGMAAGTKRMDGQDERIGKVERKQTWLSATIGTAAALLGGSAEHLLRVLLVAAALTALAPIALAQPASEDAPRLALLRALRSIGVEVGAVWPIGDLVYQVEAIRIERSAAGELTVTVKTRLINR